ncbi:MAG: hypothetical protein ACLQJR_31750 [Stellaceae bacterium]
MSPKARLAEITAAVAEQRRALADGALIDVAGLDAAVSELCEAAPSLPAAERPGFARALAALAAALDELAADLSRQNEATHRQRANDAYGPEGTR